MTARKLIGLPHRGYLQTGIHRIEDDEAGRRREIIVERVPAPDQDIQIGRDSLFDVTGEVRS
jgi:hypothetical protein